MDHQKIISWPHVVMFPLPILGDLSPMLTLAQLFCEANLKVTFINTTHNQKCLTKHGDIEAHFSRYPGFEFKVVPDGLPEDHPRSGHGGWIREMFQGLRAHAEPFLRDIVLGNGTEHKSHQQVTCLIADSMLSFAFQVANEAQVPVIEFRAYGACFLWISLCLPKLIRAREIPFKDNDMDRLVQNVPGMSDVLRSRDLPSFFRVGDGSNVDLERLVKIIPTQKAHSIILNTYDDLEGPILSHLQTDYNPRIYSIGPLPAHLKYRLDQAETKQPNSSTSALWEEDRSCISWLDKKPDQSVVYVSFGSSTILTRNQLMEIWAGLVHSMQYFLWVVRPDMITGTDPDSPTSDEVLLEGTKERGRLVEGWAPQEEVLGHRAVGGFLTHSGWNSTLESITAGVPMLCWPYISDQQVNSRYVSEVWRIGLDMKDTCDRVIVEKMVRDLMDHRKDELQSSMAKMSELAKMSVAEGGSSYRNLNRLIEDIKLMSKVD